MVGDDIREIARDQTLEGPVGYGQILAFILIIMGSN